MLMIDVVALNM